VSVFLFLADVPHLSACSLISLFFAIFEFRVDGGRPSPLATSILFSDEFLHLFYDAPSFF
jgi:hypothetical protein